MVHGQYGVLNTNSPCMTEKLYKRAPTITHFENIHRVIFTQNNVNDIVNNPRHTILTIFFKLCAKDIFIETLTHNKVSGFYTWNQSTEKCPRRE